MKSLYTLTVLLMLGLISAQAQTVEYALISTGASYSAQAYYTLSDDGVVTLSDDAWDLAFTTDAFGTGILLNESAPSVFTGTPPMLTLFLAPTNDFADEVYPEALTDSLYNDESSWEAGALNSVMDENNPLDYGWGAYNTASHVVEGNRVFVIRLRDESYKKFQIVSLANNVYTLKYADLDGANETTVTINKNDFAGSPFAYFSFDTGAAVASPAGWDLLYARYQAALDAGEEIVQYFVTGILSGPGVEVAEATNVDPETVDFEDYRDSLDTRLDVIGHDWKDFSLQTFSWQVDPLRAFFVKLPDNHLWKVFFVDFEGSSTGNAVLAKQDLGILSSVNDPDSNFEAFGVFPNPVVDEFTLSFTLKESQPNIPVTLVNNLGQAVWRAEVDGFAGLNVFNLQAPQVPAGIYRLVAGTARDITTHSIVIK